MAEERKRERLVEKGQGRTRMLVAALFALLLLNPPLLEIFSGNPVARLLGWPPVLLYINVIWLGLILSVVFPTLGRLVRQVWLYLRRPTAQRRD